MDEPLLSEQAVSDWLSTPAPTLKYWRTRGIGPPWIKLPNRRVRYRRRDVEAWLAAQEGAA